MARTTADLDTILAEIVSDVLASGADLCGKARKWGGRYRASRDSVWDLLAAEADRRGYDLRMAGGTAQTGPQRPVLVARG